ncbi:hypothetical protein SEA_MAGRITTE_11 [Microbacterium phage Magritte]|nr:hypothetical protein SEA_MAGRITTE_11 [Microbacterium phage Magritte]
MSLDYDDKDLLVLATSSASLDESPKENWVERGGGLPPYVRKLARAIMKTGKSKSQAIAIAISRIKKWAAGGDDVNADTRAKAAAALAKWEKLKAKNKAGQVKLSVHEDTGEGYLMLTATSAKSFNVDNVRRAWDGLQSSRRRSSAVPDAYSYSWIRELWTDHIIVENETKNGVRFEKIPYEVDGREVIFGDPVQVEQAWRESEDTAVKLTDELTENESELLADLTGE